MVVGADLWCCSWHAGHVDAVRGFAQVSSDVRIDERITGDSRHLA